MWNWKNYDMVNSQEANQTGTAVDVNGYGHILRNNVSYNPMDGSNKEARHFAEIDSSQCVLEDNVIASSADFMDCTRLSYTKLANIALCRPRQADGSLPYTPFLRAAAESSLFANHQGALFEYVPDAATATTATDRQSAGTIKTIRNGHIVLIRDNQCYDMLGNKL